MIREDTCSHGQAARVSAFHVTITEAARLSGAGRGMGWENNEPPNQKVDSVRVEQFLHGRCSRAGNTAIRRCYQESRVSGARRSRRGRRQRLVSGVDVSAVWWFEGWLKNGGEESQIARLRFGTGPAAAGVRSSTDGIAASGEVWPCAACLAHTR